MRSACAKRVEAKKRVIVRGMVRIGCKEMTKEEQYLVRREVSEIHCSPRSEMISWRTSCGR
jgi:hypothetical protein